MVHMLVILLAISSIPLPNTSGTHQETIKTDIKDLVLDRDKRLVDDDGTLNWIELGEIAGDKIGPFLDRLFVKPYVSVGKGLGKYVGGLGGQFLEWLLAEQQCCAPTLLANMDIQMCTHGYYYYSVCSIGCTGGYGLPAEVVNTVHCGADQAWVGDLEPCIEEQQCRAPTLLANMDIHMCTNGYYYNSVCSIGCAEGYGLPVGVVNTVHCGAGQTWVGDLEPCIVQCPDLESPENGALLCGNWFHGIVCQIECNSMYDIPRTALRWNGVWVCDRKQGIWSPSFVVPDCTALRRPEYMRLPNELFYFSGDCSDPNTQEKIKENFITKLNQSRYQSLCSEYEECTVDNIAVTCGLETGGRQKKESTYTNTVRVDFEFHMSVQFDDEFTSSDAASFEATIDNKFAAMAKLFDEDVTSGIMDLTIPGLDIGIDVGSYRYGLWEMECDVGMVPSWSTISCASCPTGTMFNSTTDDCEDCAIGTYQDEDGQLTCKQCPEFTSTEKSRATNLSQCIVMCNYGHYSKNGLAECAKCPVGTFQDSRGANSCTNCAPGTTTLSEGSTKVERCLTNVNAGYTTWSQWTDCSLTCGSGTRTRECVNPQPEPEGLPCFGEALEMEACNTHDCPVCPSLRLPNGVKLTCSDVGKDRICEMNCRDGMVFYPPTEKPYVTCGVSTNYVWSNSIGDSVDAWALSKCAKSLFAKTYIFKAIIETPEVDCDKVTNTAAIENFVEEHNTCTVTSVCDTSLEDTCDLSTGHHKRGTKLALFDRSKRQVSHARFIIQVEGTIGNPDYFPGGVYDDNIATLAAQEFETITTQMLTIAQALLTAITETSLNINAEDQNYMPAVYIGANYECPSGAVQTFGLCVTCPIGTYQKSKLCQPCALGFYQDQEGMAICIACPPGLTTSYVGSETISECSVTDFDDVDSEYLTTTGNVFGPVRVDQEIGDINGKLPLPIIGGVLGCVILLMSLIFGGIMYWRFKTKKSKETKIYQNEIIQHGETTTVTIPPKEGAPAYNTDSPPAYEAAVVYSKQQPYQALNKEILVANGRCSTRASTRDITYSIGTRQNSSTSLGKSLDDTCTMIST